MSLFLLLLFVSARAATVTGVPTLFTQYGSDASWACSFKISTSTYYVDDTDGKFSCTCSAAMAASMSGGSLSVSYTTSGTTRIASGLYASDATSNVPYVYTDSYPGMASDTKIKAYFSGKGYLSVKDSTQEDAIQCSLASTLHFAVTETWTVSYDPTTLEVTSIGVGP